MERIQSLINRLQEQVDQHAGAEQMLATIQLIQAELGHTSSQPGKILGTSKVAVIMPASTQFFVKQEEEKEFPAQVIQKQKPVAVVSKPRNQLDLHFDPLTDIPTLSQQQYFKEVNESVSQQESLNDRLKENKTELMHVLKDSPIRDLRKAIGINDRFVFINELFRGDEAMYERCIKTINSFNIYAEAEYWMNRELMVKLGWDNERESVKHFYQLVKRRFS
jgi:hypothetical protein